MAGEPGETRLRIPVGAIPGFLVLDDGPVLMNRIGNLVRMWNACEFKRVTGMRLDLQRSAPEYAITE